MKITSGGELNFLMWLLVNFGEERLQKNYIVKRRLNGTNNIQYIPRIMCFPCVCCVLLGLVPAPTLLSLHCRLSSATCVHIPCDVL